MKHSRLLLHNTVIQQLTYIDTPWGNRKAFRSAAAQGLAVTELKPKDNKAIAEAMRLYKHLFDAKMISS